MKKEIVIDGVSYVVGTYSYGKEIEINDRIMGVEFDVKTKTPIPMIKGGLQKMLVVLASLKSWTFRGVDGDGEVINDNSKSILPISEENIKLLPKKHGDKLIDLANDLNGVSEDDEKNSPK